MNISPARVPAAASIALTLALGAHTISGLQAQAPATVKFDFRVVTDEGQPVTDLEASDVTLRIGGKARTIRSLELVQASTEEPAAPAAAGPAAPAFATNTAAAGDGRSLLLVVDDESIMAGRDQSLKAALTHILSELSPHDRVGLLSIRRSGGVNIAPTTDHQAIRTAIGALAGQGLAENAEAFRCRTTVALQTLQSVLTTAGADTPMSIVFFSAALAQPGEAMGRIGSSSDLCRLMPEHFEQVGTTLAASRANLYVVHVTDGTTRTITESAPGVENIAGVAGTETLRLVGNGEVMARRVLRETTAYYVATLEPDRTDTEKAPQRVELKIARDGVQVRARPSVVFAKRDANADGKASPRDMVRVEEVYHDLPLRAAGYASRDTGQKDLKVVAVFEPNEGNVKLTSAIVGLISAEGKLTRQWTAQKADLERSPVMAALTAPAGSYRLRVAAVDATGRSGTVDYALDANLDAAGPLRMSAPLLGSPPTAQAGFTPKLLFTPDDAAVVSYLEVYDVPKGATVTAALELAPNETAAPLGTTETQIAQGPTADVRLVVGGFGIATLEPGDYTVRTIVSVDGKEVGRALATLKKIGS